MPNHPNTPTWRTQARRYRYTAVARPEDLQNGAVMDGRPVKSWVSGYNIGSNGGSGNHQIFPHPSYMASPGLQSGAARVWWALAGETAPWEVYGFNQAIIYRAFVDNLFLDQRAGSPGYGQKHTIYQPDGTVYWYHATEYDRRERYYSWATLDTLARILGRDTAASTRATVWEKLHLQRLSDHQHRYSDGRVGEGKEHNTAADIATAYLANWLEARGAFGP